MASLKSNVADSGKSLTDATTSSDGSIDFDALSSTIFNKFIDVVEAAIVLTITILIVRWLKGYFSRIEIKHEQQRTALNVIEKILAGFIIVIGVTIALKVVGIDMSVLVGVGLLGLSYGLKDIIKNYIAGILIFLKSPFKIGDIVKIKNFVGKIEKMEFQSTSIKTFDHREITIYNSDIMAQSIENYSSYPMRRMEINVKLGYGTNMEKAVQVFDKILGANADILKDPKYTIVFKNFSDNSVILQLKFWVKVPSNMLKIRSDIAWQINQAFDESTVFGPYSKSFQSDKDFSLTEERKNKTQEFYKQPMFTTAAPQTAAAAPGQPGQPPTIIVDDVDEPSVEEDL
ncbi:MAG: mechanosensitive ion channel domain-containing protein [Patescibacteria group bacterium]